MFNAGVNSNLTFTMIDDIWLKVFVISFKSLVRPRKDQKDFKGKERPKRFTFTEEILNGKRHFWCSGIYACG